MYIQLQEVGGQDHTLAQFRRSATMAVMDKQCRPLGDETAEGGCARDPRVMSWG